MDRHRRAEQALPRLCLKADRDHRHRRFFISATSACAAGAGDLRGCAPLQHQVPPAKAYVDAGVLGSRSGKVFWTSRRPAARSRGPDAWRNGRIQGRTRRTMGGSTHIRPRAKRSATLTELAGLPKYVEEHLFRELARDGVLQRRMI